MLDSQIASTENEIAEIQHKREIQIKQIAELKQLIAADTQRLNVHKGPEELKERYLKAKQKHDQATELLKRDQVRCRPNIRNHNRLHWLWQRRNSPTRQKTIRQLARCIRRTLSRCTRSLSCSNISRKSSNPFCKEKIRFQTFRTR